MGGAAIFNATGSPWIENCTFANNQASSYGGAILNGSGCMAVITNCLFFGNRAAGGGAVRNEYFDWIPGGICTPMFQNCLFDNNEADTGGAVKNGIAAPIFVHCTFNGNRSTTTDPSFAGGGAIWTYSSPAALVRNCILWGNQSHGSEEFNEIRGTYIGVTFSCVKGGFPGEGNISTDPLFATATNHDFHLQSIAGHWTTNGWVTDAQHSPCIDAGSLSDEFSSEPLPNGSQVNMGCYGNTAQASKSARMHRTTTATAGLHGSIVPSGTVFVAQAMDQMFTFLPASGYAVGDVLVDGISIGITNRYTFKNITTNHTIQALFTNAHKIVSTIGGKGTMTLLGDVWVGNGQSQTFVMMPDSGYTLSTVEVDGVSVGAVDTYTFQNVTNGHSITALFVPSPYLLTDQFSILAYGRQGTNAPSTTFNVWNSGIGSVSYTISDNVAWLSCTPVAGSSTNEHDAITLMFDSAGLAAGTHVGTITVTAPGVENSSISIAVELAVFGNGVVYVNHSASGADNGSSWNNAFTRVQDAWAVAQAGEELWVAEGTYKPTDGTDRHIPFQMKGGVNIYGGFTGTEISREQRNWITHETILSGEIGALGNGDNSYQVIRGANNALLDGFTVTGGNASATIEQGPDPWSMGGGMFNSGVSPTVRHCIFRDNKATGYYASGGGMYNRSCTTLVEQCQFISNIAGEYYNLGGGGMYNDYGSSPVIRDCLFQNNHSVSFNPYGGGIKNDNANATIQRCVFTENSAGEGSCIENWDDSHTLVEDCLFVNNSGNAVDNDSAGASSQVTLINCTFHGNSGTDVWTAWSSSRTTIKNSIFNGVYLNYSATTNGTTVEYSCVKNGYAGVGNISADPQFVDVTNGNYRLMNTLRNPSPCINAGNNAAVSSSTDLAGKPRIQHGTVDMGAYEAGTPYTTWWYPRGVLTTNQEENQYAIANLGQLKWIAKKASEAMDATLSGGAGTNITVMVNSFVANSNNYHAVNLGQLKNVAKPFYDRLWALGRTNAYPIGSGTNKYPWQASTNAPSDYRPANIGQLKYLFSFELE